MSGLDPSSPPPDTRRKPASYARSTAFGLAMHGLSAGAAKGGAFIALIALGWILSSDDFALYALALGASAMFMVFKDAGVTKLLIQRGKEYDRLRRPVFQISLVINLLVGTLLAAAASPIARFYDSTTLFWMILIIAVAVPLGTGVGIQKAKLSIDLRFGSIANVNVATTIVRYSSMIIFALLGFGPISFVLPIPLTLLFQNIAFRWVLRGYRPQEPPLPLTWNLFLELFRSVRWIVLMAFFTAIASQGDYLVIGALAPAVLGFYMFGYQLTSSFKTLITTGIMQVMLPTFSQLTDDPDRQARAFLKAIRMFTSVTIPACVGGSLVVGDIIRIFWWQGQWNDSIIVAQVLVLVLAFGLILPVGRSLIASRGEWALLMGMTFGSAVFTLVAAAIGGVIGTIFAVTIAIACARVTWAVAQTGVISWRTGISFFAIWKPVAARFSMALLAGAVCVLVYDYLLAIAIPLVRAPLVAITYGLLVSAAWWGYFRADIDEVMRIVKSRGRKKKSPPPDEPPMESDETWETDQTEPDPRTA